MKARSRRRRRRPIRAGSAEVHRAAKRWLRAINAERRRFSDLPEVTIDFPARLNQRILAVTAEEAKKMIRRRDVSLSVLLMTIPSAILFGKQPIANVTHSTAAAEPGQSAHKSRVGGARRDEITREAREKAARYIAENLARLGIAVPDRELKEQLVEPVHGSVVIRYRQMHEGVPVHTGELIVRVGESGRVSCTNKLIRGIKVNVTPTIDERKARALAVQLARLRGEPEEVAAQLVVIPARSFDQAVPEIDRLVWRVAVTADNELDRTYSHTFFVDAHSGERIHDVSNVRRESLTHLLTGPQLRGRYYQDQLATIATPTSGKLANATIKEFILQDPCYGSGISLSGYQTYSQNSRIRICGHTEGGVDGHEVELHSGRGWRPGPLSCELSGHHRP